MRSNRGNMFVLTVSVTALLFVPLIMVIGSIVFFNARSRRAQDVVEAASKVAAMDLARVVINDPNFGYVSLSNHPATGTATVAADGQSLPVVGIETWMRTMERSEAIGNQLNNRTILSLVDADRTNLQDTVTELNNRLLLSIDDQGSVGRDAATDMNGTRVIPSADVDKFLRDNLPANVELQKFTLCLGWVEDTQAPLLDDQAHLISQTRFRQPDGKHLCNAIKLECEFGSNIQCVACCQSFSEPDHSTPGKMTVRFTSIPVLGLLSWSEFLASSSFRDNRILQFIARNGDYPMEPHSELRLADIEEKVGTADQFASHLYYWLRSLHGKAKVEAVTAIMNQPFEPHPQQRYDYALRDDGSIERIATEEHEYKRGATADGERCTVSDTVPRGNPTAIICFRNNTIQLGTTEAKHAGMPLEGQALDIEIGGTQPSRAREDVISMRTRTRMRRI